LKGGSSRSIIRHAIVGAPTHYIIRAEVLGVKA
jgi:hypothetical protein